MFNNYIYGERRHTTFLPRFGTSSAYTLMRKKYPNLINYIKYKNCILMNPWKDSEILENINFTYVKYLFKNYDPTITLMTPTITLYILYIY